MPTRTILSNSTVTRLLRQTPAEAVDLDGYKELCLYLNVSDVDNGGSTLRFFVYHAPRNEESYYDMLWNPGDITGATSTLAYVDEFMRYVKVKAIWQTANSTTSADVELLAVPKVR